MPGRPANARGRRRPRCTRTTPSCEKKMRNSNLKKETFLKEEIGEGRAADIEKRSEEFFVGSKSIWKKQNPRSLLFYSETFKRCRNIPTVAFKLKKKQEKRKNSDSNLSDFLLVPIFFNFGEKKLNVELWVRVPPYDWKLKNESLFSLKWKKWNSCVKKNRVISFEFQLRHWMRRTWRSPGGRRCGRETWRRSSFCFLISGVVESIQMHLIFYAEAQNGLF